MKVSLHLNNFAVKNLHETQSKNNNANPRQNMIPPIAASSCNNNSNVLSFGGWLDCKRGSAKQFFYECTEAFKDEITASDEAVQGQYSNRFLGKAAQFAKQISEERGSDTITQRDREGAIRNNLKYLLTDEEMVGNFKYKKMDRYGNKLPQTPLDFENYYKSFLLMRNGSEQSRGYFNALVTVLKEIKPMTRHDDRVLRYWEEKKKPILNDTVRQIPINNLRAALKTSDSVHIYTRDEIGLYDKHVSLNETPQPELKSMVEGCRYLYV